MIKPNKLASIKIPMPLGIPIPKYSLILFKENLKLNKARFLNWGLLIIIAIKINSKI